MLDYLQKLKNDPDGPYDAIFFLPTDDEETLKVEVAMFKEPGEKIGGSQIGDSYNIVLFRDNPEDDNQWITDRFDAILIDPYEYVSGLIPQNWYGIVARKTTSSDAFIQKIFDNM